jgi:capsular exopolysaccharide synthesis family protein
MQEEDYQQPEETTGSLFDWRNVFYILLENFWLIAFCLAASAGLTAIYLARAQVVYEATSTLKYEQQQPKILNIEGVVQEEEHGEDVLTEKVTEIEQLLKSPATLARIIASNNFASNPHFAIQVAPIAPGDAGGTAKLATMISVKLRKGTHLIDVSVEHSDPEISAQLADALVNEVIRQNEESYRDASQQATAFLAEEAQQLQHKLNEAEGKLQTYKDQSLSLEQRQAIVAENLKSLNEKVEAAKTERVRLETEYQHAREVGDDVQGLLALPPIANDPTVVAIRADISAQEIEFDNIKQVYLPKHPAYIQAQSKMEKLQQVLSQATMKAAQVMRVSYENAQAQEAALEKELAKQEDQAQSLNKQFVPYNVLLRDIEQYRALYDSVVKRMGETTIAGNLDTQTIQIFQNAEVPKKPIKPNKPVLIAFGVAIGLTMGLALALGRGFLDDSFKTLSEAEQYLKMPVLSTIPEIHTVRTGEKQLVMEDDGPASGAESFRCLRTSLSMQSQEKQLRSYLFTSAMPGEGKTFCAVNYAVSLAQQGLSTLLIDCDLRRPMVDEFLYGEDRNKNVWGVTQFMGGKQNFDDVVQVSKIANLWTLSAGPYASNAPELLTHASCTQLLEEALRRFDRVVVDSAPIFGVSDTLLLVNHVDSVCLVVRVRKTPKSIAMRALKVLERAGTPLSGVVLNAVPRSRRSAYGDPYYDYGYYPKESRAGAQKA